MYDAYSGINKMVAMICLELFCQRLKALGRRGERGDPRAWPFDLMLNNAPFERVSCDSKEACRLHNVAPFVKGVLTKGSFCFG